MDMDTPQTTRPPPRRTGLDSRRHIFQFFARGSVGFLEDLPFFPPSHSGAAPYSPRFTLIGSKDPDVKFRATPLHRPIWRPIYLCAHFVFFHQMVSCRRCRCSAGFLEDLPFPPPLNSGAAPLSPRFTLIGSQDLSNVWHPAYPTRPSVHLANLNTGLGQRPLRENNTRVLINKKLVDIEVTRDMEQLAERSSISAAICGKVPASADCSVTSLHYGMGNRHQDGSTGHDSNPSLPSRIRILLPNCRSVSELRNWPLRRWHTDSTLAIPP
ncbi:hypothetical protein PR048_022708 [Dryococelus australis]|uniref:Uncharacterized protein n=1 Tax=Dryococelus australis TaxID=614101 RepID=A0ABQ9GS09_9NEOP|nr:hypothetical protein PR048_022708 [Dryococelus australis]